jgi:hypothetical protein
MPDQVRHDKKEICVNRCNLWIKNNAKQAKTIWTIADRDPCGYRNHRDPDGYFDPRRKAVGQLV